MERRLRGASLVGAPGGRLVPVTAESAGSKAGGASSYRAAGSKAVY
jgi:hypothetical protein